MENTANKSGGVGSGDEISLKELVLKIREWYRYLLTKWKVIVLAGIVGGLIGFTYAYLKKPIYTAECTFVLEEQGAGGGLGQYAGLASMVGIDIGGAGGSGLFQGDNIIELYKSRRMIEEALLTEARFHGMRRLLIDYYIEFNGLREKWANSPRLKSISFNIPKSKFKLQHDSIITQIVQVVNKENLIVQKLDKKLNIISVRMTSEDEQFSKAFTDAIVQTVNRFYLETKTKKSLENLMILQKQADSIRQILNTSIRRSAMAVDANPNANAALQVLRVPLQRNQVDVQASSAIYAEVAKNLEIARISLRKETPLIQLVDRPVLPLRKTKVGQWRGTVIGAFILSFLAVLLMILGKAVKEAFNNSN